MTRATLVQINYRRIMPSPWNSLEIAKLIASCATPVIVVCLGIYIHRVTKRFEHSQWRNQKLIEKRLAIYDELAPRLNELLCYFCFVGKWKDVNPPEIVELKREVDRQIHLAKPLFSDRFFKECMNFMDHCFSTYQGWGIDAKLRTTFDQRQKAHPNWQKEWTNCFSDKPSTSGSIRIAYAQIMNEFASEIGLEVSPQQSSKSVPEIPN